MNPRSSLAAGVIAIAAALCGALWWSARATPSSPFPEGVIARCAGVQVYGADLEARVAEASDAERARFTAEPETLLDEELTRALLADEARRIGLASLPAVRRAEELALVRELRAALPRPEASPAARGAVPERRRALVLFTRTEGEARDAASSVSATLRDRSLDALAAQSSALEGVPHRGGDLGYFGAHLGEGEPELAPQLRAALFRIEAVGEASPPLPLPPVFAIVVLVARREAHEETLPTPRLDPLATLGVELERAHVRELSPERASPADIDVARADRGLSPAQAARVLARIDRSALTLGDLADELAAMSRTSAARLSLVEHRGEVLASLVRRRVLADEARRRSLRVRRDVDAALATSLTRHWQTQGALAPPDEAAIERFYEAHRAMFSRPVRRRARLFVTPAREAAVDAIARLQQDPVGTSTRRDVGRSVPSAAPRVEAGDETRELTRPPGEAALYEPADVRVARAAFSVDVGQVVPQPVRVEEGYAVVQPITEVPATERSLEEARADIAGALRSEALARRVARVLDDSRAQLEIDHDALAALMRTISSTPDANGQPH